MSIVSLAGCSNCICFCHVICEAFCRELWWLRSVRFDCLIQSVTKGNDRLLAGQCGPFVLWIMNDNLLVWSFRIQFSPGTLAFIRALNGYFLDLYPCWPQLRRLRKLSRTASHRFQDLRHTELRDYLSESRGIVRAVDWTHLNDSLSHLALVRQHCGLSLMHLW